MMAKKNHTFHMVDMSPWPLISSLMSMMLVLSIVLWFSKSDMMMLFFSLFMVFLSSFQWWRDVSREGSYQGLHTNQVINGLKMGMILFIVSEVLFFFSFFWGFFHNSLSPNIELGSNWPPLGVTVFDPIKIPLLNTMILLSSGVTITWSHHSMMEGSISKSMWSLLITVILGVYFSCLQLVEYIESSFCISDSSYGSSFFISTGFHGIHVLIGSTFLLVTLFRSKIGLLSSSHHFGFEASAWYWHFVDVVWLFLYLNLYWWGS